MADSSPTTSPELAELRRLRALALSYAEAAAVEPNYRKRRRLEQTALRLWQEARKRQGHTAIAPA